MTPVKRDPECSRPHAGHRRYVGGPLDGEVEHLVSAAPGDFPLFVRHPTGSFYERDLDGGTEATYRLVGTVDRA